MSDKSIQCVRVKSPRGARMTEIEWGDGHHGRYPHEVLRGYCPCAGCQGHSGSIAYKEASGTQVEIEEIEAVGNYALRFQWFDGHGSGLYSYKYLRALCHCEICHPPRASEGESGAVEHPDLPRM